MDEPAIRRQLNKAKRIAEAKAKFTLALTAIPVAGRINPAANPLIQIAGFLAMTK